MERALREAQLGEREKSLVTTLKALFCAKCSNTSYNSPLSSKLTTEVSGFRRLRKASKSSSSSLPRPIPRGCEVRSACQPARAEMLRAKMACET